MTTILLIESDAMLCEVLRYHLTSEKYALIEAYTVADGIALARSHAPDLILLAITLRDMPGMSCCQILRTESSVPILLLAIIAGPLARRIDSQVNLGDHVQAGARLSKARFGSRVDLLLPRDAAEALPEIGDRLHAGATRIGHGVPL